MQGTKGKVDSPFTCDVIACLVWLGLALGGTNSPDLHGIDDCLQTKNTIVKMIPPDRQALFHTDEFSRVFLSCNGGRQVLGLVFGHHQNLTGLLNYPLTHTCRIIWSRFPGIFVRERHLWTQLYAHLVASLLLVS
ncbi:hypothetical protein NC652_016729 [Populus alba x Populus x berolinensis]|uniref:Uncharacterized protein n=1 Tax=Populus alba x Populus x berolinensis TaxID=444605 RepID=A0AAD6QNH4_9ROSI|nr:hypothetical protein NC652_016729 [Populus alba x Populus x berolinensis]KAJ6993590.1 hypothetical protein NC653_016659 [Populus alba x Populus x berolinensis]